MNLPSLIQTVYAAATDVIGTIEPGKEFLPYGSLGTGVMQFFTNILRLIFVGAGIYTFMNLITAGFQYMSAGGDTKALTAAWARIWQTLLGLLIIVASFAIASLFGYLFFGNAGFILNPKIYGPK